MSNEEINAITERLERIERLSLINAKTILDINEAAVFVGFTVGHLYHLTSGRKIPHFKKNRKVFFKKSDLEAWLCEKRVLTEEEINQRAETYTATHKLLKR